MREQLVTENELAEWEVQSPSGQGVLAWFTRTQRLIVAYRQSQAAVQRLMDETLRLEREAIALDAGSPNTPQTNVGASGGAASTEGTPTAEKPAAPAPTPTHGA